jgi:mono/diheme cytochrome c family protein
MKNSKIPSLPLWPDVIGYSGSQSMKSDKAIVSPIAKLLFTVVVICISGTGVASQDATSGKFYKLIDGKVDDRTYNGFRRYHASCNHCHGSDGLGSTFGPSLVNRLLEIEQFRRVVREGQATGTSVMQGFADDPNVAPYVDDIFAYLQARADGALGRGRPRQPNQKPPLSLGRSGGC